MRAPGFREFAFENTVGKDRYRWLRKLGNARIGSRRGGVKIVDPAGAQDLLELVVAAARERRQVIFFCACKRPADCHRTAAVDLLLKAARRNGRRLSVVEWPGGEPQTADLQVSDKVIGDMLRGATRVPLAGEEFVRSASSPLYRGGQGFVPPIRAPGPGNRFRAGAVGCRLVPTCVIGPDVKATDTVESLQLEAARVRKGLGYSERKS